jgi:hypothetical protein
LLSFISLRCFDVVIKRFGFIQDVLCDSTPSFIIISFVLLVSNYRGKWSHLFLDVRNRIYKMEHVNDNSVT